MQQNDKQENIPSILRHLNKWKPLYEITAVISVLVAIIFGGISILQTQKALDVAISSLNIQEKEFLLRNRPLVVIGSHQLDGPAGDSKGNKFPRAIKAHLVNISEIPASRVQGTFEVRLNGNVIGTSKLSPISVTKETVRTLALGLTEQLYNEAINPNNNFETTTKLTYSGMLGEKYNQYVSEVRVYW